MSKLPDFPKLVVIMPRVSDRLPPVMAALLVSVFGAAGCSPPQKPTSKADGEGESKSPYGEMAPPEKLRKAADPPSPKKITAKDLERLTAFGEAYTRAISEGDDAVAQASWNMEAMLKIALGDSGEIAPEFTAGVKRGAIDSLKKKPGGILWTTFESPCRLLRIREVEGETRILCRAVTEEGLNYYDLIPQINADGDPEFVDLYSFSSGEKISATFRRLILPQIADAAKTPIEKLFTTPDPLVKHIGQFMALSHSFQTGAYGETLEHFESLPSEIQKNKAVLLIYMGAAGKLMTDQENPDAEKAYHEGVIQFEKLFGDDPAFLLMGIDFYFFQEDYDGALKAIDQLDKVVGGDPYLDFFRASAKLSQENYQEALPLAQKAIANDPEIEDAYWGIVNIQLALSNFKAVAEGLDKLVEQFDYELDLKEDPAYDEFRLSPVGKAWIEKHVAQ